MLKLKGGWRASVNKQVVFITLVTVFLLLIMSFISAGQIENSGRGNAVHAVTVPVHKLIANVCEGIDSFLVYFKNKQNMQKENDELLLRISKLEEEKRTLEQYQTENSELRSLLELKTNLRDYTSVAAAVIAKEPGNWFNSFTIDKGLSDGVGLNDAVVTSEGLVGYVKQVGEGYSVVSAIIDINNSVGCTITRTGEAALLEADISLQNLGFCKLSYIPKGANVMPGDVIETSGLGGIYPKGILVGRVDEIKTQVQGVSDYAVVRPMVNFRKLSYVLVLSIERQAAF